jgi:hypothetical protein
MKWLAFLFGSIFGVGATTGLFYFSDFHVPIYSFTFEEPPSQNDVINFNSSVSFDFCEVLVAPSEEGYDVMISSSLDQNRRNKVFETIRDFFAATKLVDPE